MKNHAWILVTGSLLALALAPSACGSSGTGGAGGSVGGGTTTGSTTTSGTTTTSHSTTSGSTTSGTTSSTASSGSTTSGTTTSSGVTTSSQPPGDCTGLLTAECGTCAEASCCVELAGCANDSTGNCFDCLTGNAADPALCMDEPTLSLYQAMLKCAQDNCQVECLGPLPSCDAPTTAPSGGSCVTIGTPAEVLCNPVTNAPCTAGQACDFGDGGFKCYDPPNDALLCGDCDVSSPTGPFCEGTLTCLSGKCARFCCTDGDCGTGTCDLTQTGVDGIGICIAP